MTIPTIRLRFNPSTPKLRVRVLPGIPPLQAELRNNGTAIQWRVGGTGTWIDLIQIDELITPAQLLGLLLTVDGSGSALDADLLDGHDSSYFAVAASLVGAEVTVTATGTTAVDAATRAELVNLASPGSVTLTLPSVASRNGLPLTISDIGGNADITLTPNGSEKIMGLSTAELISSGQGLGTGASITLYPSTANSGWYQ